MSERSKTGCLYLKITNLSQKINYFAFIWFSCLLVYLFSQNFLSEYVTLSPGKHFFLIT